jgi:GTP-binding protein
MSLPKLAIVGRPNVGKSALFNKLCGSRISIVDEAEGITRDRVYAKGEFFGKPFEVIDTAGLDFRSKAQFNELMIQQTEIAIEEADALVLVVDGTVGVHPLDVEVARILLRTKKPVTLAINKIDHPELGALMHEFYELGIQEMLPISCIHAYHMAELLELAFRGVNFEGVSQKPKEGISVAIVGRPNVGKSTLINHILDEDRCIVSPIAGTTRDAIDVKVEAFGKQYTFIDTAGIRRKAGEKEVVDKFAYMRTQAAIERADVCVLMIDAESGLTSQEKRIAQMIEEEGKACVIVLNKWDLVKGYRMEHCLKALQMDASFLAHCPTLFISALEGRNVDKLFSLIEKAYAATSQRITTGQLNKFIEKTLQKYHPPMIQGKRLRIYYMAQIGIEPPRFVVFVNKAELMAASYKKYLINAFRETFNFEGCPLEFILRGKNEAQRPEDPQETPKEEVKQAEEITYSQQDDDFDLEAVPDLQEELDDSYYS